MRARVKARIDAKINIEIDGIGGHSGSLIICISKIIIIHRG